MPVNTWCCLKMINNLLLLIFLCTISLKLCSQNDLTNYTSDENVSTFSEDNSNPLDRFSTPCTANNRSGYCVEITTCKMIHRNIELFNEDQISSFIKDHSCGPKNENKSIPRVCCPLQTDDIGENSKNTINNKEVLPRKCGQRRTILESKVYGGVAASLGEYPWMARIIHKNQNGHLQSGCGGLLIHKRYVLTAAHCVILSEKSSFGPIDHIILGDYNINTDPDCVIEDGQDVCADKALVVGIQTFHIHEGYIRGSRHQINDIALIQLSQKVNFTDYIKPICLSTQTSNSNYFEVAGWGRTEISYESKILQKVILSKYDFAECKNKYSALNIHIENSQICVGGDRGKDSCSGDSGGPLMYFDDSAGGSKVVYYAAGITSYGYHCGIENWPGVYTNITAYYDWIVNKIRKK